MFIDQKYYTLDTLGAKTQKRDYKDQKPNLRFFLGLKRAIGLKSCFGGVFEKNLVFVHQSITP